MKFKKFFILIFLNIIKIFDIFKWLDCRISKKSRFVNTQNISKLSDEILNKIFISNNKIENYQFLGFSNSNFFYNLIILIQLKL